MACLVIMTLCMIAYGNKTEKTEHRREEMSFEITVWATRIKNCNTRIVLLFDGRYGKMLLTSTDLGDHSLCQRGVLCQLLSEALTHVVINIIGPQQLLKGL